MTKLLETQEKLSDTTAAIARLEREIAAFPDSPALLANMRSLEKRKNFLEHEFLVATDELGFDVCSYRLLPDHGRPTVQALSRALGGFQALFSVVYDALKNGPKHRARLSPESISDTEFGFAYTFPGSLGIVMTLRNERLIGDSHLDDAMNTVFVIAQAKSPSDISGLAKKLGPSSVRKAYAWASDHVESGLSVEIEWRRSEEVRSTILVQTPELEKLRAAISSTSDQVDEKIELSGKLVGADTMRHTFHLETAGGPIHGKFGDAISEEQSVTLPRSYSVTLRKTTRVLYSTEEDKVEYFLLKLS